MLEQRAFAQGNEGLAATVGVGEADGTTPCHHDGRAASRALAANLSLGHAGGLPYHPDVLPDDLVPKRKPWPVVLGIDPGTHNMGYGALVLAPPGVRFLACGVLRAAARAGVAQRLGTIAAELDQVLRQLRPDALALERAYYARNVQSTLRLGEARGVVLSAAARQGIEVFEYAPSEAKKAVVGDGGATKERVARMLETHLGQELDLSSDATDALALALAHCHRQGVRELLAKARPGSGQGS